MLQKLFGGKELYRRVNPDEAVAFGAAVLAVKLNGSTDRSIEDLLLLDVTPLSLGVDVKGELFDVVIPRNTKIPTKKFKNYITIEDNQSSMILPVYQGERTESTMNHLLGSITAYGIPPAPKGVMKLQTCFEIDADGILTLTSKVLSTDRTNQLTISNAKGRLSKAQIEKMTKEAEKYKLEDQDYKEKVKACNDLDDYIYDMKKKVEECNVNKRLHPEILKVIEKAIDDASEWLQDNQAAPVSEVHTKKADLEFVCNPLGFF